MSISIISMSNTPEPLLSRRVPDLQFHPSLIDGNDFILKIKYKKNGTVSN